MTAAELFWVRVLYLGGAAWLLWTLLRTVLHIRRDAQSIQRKTLGQSGAERFT
jgi:hypothetical protein